MQSLKTLWMLVSLQTQSSILERRNRPQLVMAICMPAFQILNGINSILFYAPVLFQTMGFGNATLYSSALTGAVLVLSTVVSIGLVDRLGRRVLLISGGIQMVLCQVHIQKTLHFCFFPPYNSFHFSHFGMMNR